MCRKDLLRHYRTPTLIHHGSKWAYHFPEYRQVTIRCPQEEGQYARTVSLVGSGLILNASACHISTQEVRTIPVLSKTAEQNLDAPLLFLPDSVPALLLVFACRSHLRNLFIRGGQVKADPSPIAAPRVTSDPATMLERLEDGHQTSDPQDPVTFASYALQYAPR